MKNVSIYWNKIICEIIENDKIQKGNIFNLGMSIYHMYFGQHFMLMNETDWFQKLLSRFRVIYNLSDTYIWEQTNKKNTMHSYFYNTTTLTQ